MYAVHSAVPIRPSTQPSPSVHPLPRLCGQFPMIRARSSSRGEEHAVDLGYEATNFGGKLFVPVYAVQDGRISYVDKADDGYAITLDHGTWSSHYAHLEHAFVATRGRAKGRPERVRAGDVLGYASEKPSLHVRFEMWRYVDDELVPIDPEPHLARWLVMPNHDSNPIAA